MNTRYNNPIRMSGAVKLRMILLVLVPLIVVLVTVGSTSPVVGL